MSKTAAELDRDIAESYLGMTVSANAFVIPRRGAPPVRRIRGIVREIDTSAGGAVMLWLEQPDGQRVHAFLSDIVPDIPQATARTRHHATTKKGSLGRNVITEEQARSMPRFEFVAHWLAVVTRKKENRDLAHGKRVRHAGGKWQIVYPNGLVEYETSDADRLFDYARRGPLGWHIRNAENFRAEAYQRTGTQ